MMFVTIQCLIACDKDKGAILKGYGKGQVFSTTDDTYVLNDIVRIPKYDSDTSKGYAVIFLKKKPTLPIISFGMSSLGGGATPTQPTALNRFSVN
ncbi:MAG: hypothetical protein LBH14_05855 [Desulfobulbaceae bacterium]|jgi:hypothetical protein|nr:hypothetical protein [Desulfobulbaceae bacterium]